jgi:O-antigen/teichoic acid export membrane protein
MRRLWRSPTLRSVAVLGLSGVGFAIANLMLARALTTTEYALFTLVVALVNVGYPLAPAGVDGVVNRLPLEAGPRLLRRILRTIVPAGLLLATIGLVGYETSPTVTLMILASTMAGGALMVAAGQFQSEQRFGISLALNQSPNLILLLSAVWVVLAGTHGAEPPLLIWTVGFVATAVAGWWVLFRERHAKPPRSVAFPWNEAFAIAGLSAAGLLLIQLERLLIPHLLPLHDLATYGVLAAIVGSLFRVLQMGVGYSLLPRLRAAPGVLERRRLIAREVRLVIPIVTSGSAAIWVATPYVERWFLGGKYHLSAALVLAALVTGVIKILNGFAQSTVSALADPRELSVVSVLGWIAVAIAVVAAIAGASWGLPGVIYGVGIGWLVRSSTALYMTARHLRLPATAPAVMS